MKKASAKLALPLLLLVLGLLSAVTTFAQPAPTPDPAYPNIFYGALAPSAAAQAPVLLFIHGLGSNALYWFTAPNDMYTDAYNAGYRTAFLSFNADNSNNSATIAQNALVLQNLLPAILAHFNTQTVYLICHSKGGLDAQDAMLDINTRKYVRAVMTISTPNQGTALADWAFGPGQAIASKLGLLTPGLNDLKVENIANFRAMADPVFQSSGIPFFTLSGDQVFTQGNPILLVTNPILKNLTGESNDGLVTPSETVLPDSYSNDLGTIHSDHFQIAYGVNSWAFAYGRINGFENMVTGWQMISSGGFGDDNNTWNWSQAWFQGKLYVGTGRDMDCVTIATSDVQQGTHLYPPPGCTPDYLDLSTSAEIWQYTPQTHTWARVYKSPQDIPLGNDSAGNPAFAGMLGFRGMTVYTESDGTQALYVGGVSSNSMYGSLPQYAPYNYPPPIILRSTDGVSFNAIPHDPGTFMGDIIKNNTDINVVGFRSLLSYNGQMFASVSNLRGEGFVIASPDPKSGDNAWQRVTPTPESNLPVWTMSVFNNYLYLGTGNRTTNVGYGLYKTDATGPAPYQYQAIIINGGWQTDNNSRSPVALTLHTMNDGSALLLGTDRKTEMDRIYADDSWDLLIGQPRTTPTGYKAPLSGIGYYFDNDSNGHFWQISDSNNGIHFSTWDWSVNLQSTPLTNAPSTSDHGFDFYRSPDGLHWYIESKDGLGDGYNFGGRSANYNHFGLFWGTARSRGGSQMWLDNSVLDQNGDHIIDIKDVQAVLNATGQSAVPGNYVGHMDPRDVNGDGVINSLDARTLVTQCTFPGCASIPPSTQILRPTAPTFQGFLTAGTVTAVGQTVVLNWPAAANAVRYHVYRYTSLPLVQWILGTGPTAPTSVQIPIGDQTFNFPGDVISGKLDFLCPDTPYCPLIEQVKGGASTPDPNAPVGWTGPLEEIAQTSGTTYSEAPPTINQSLYFIRAEDANGVLTSPSNVVGAPSLAP